MNITRDDLRRAVSEPETTYVCQFGCESGAGFCAEYLGFLHGLMKCLQFGIGFKFGRVARPRGFITRNGWTDYFLPFCDEVDAPLLDRMNVSQFPFARKFPFTKLIARAWLKTLSDPPAQYFMFDDLGEIKYLGPPVFDEDQEYFSARRDLMRILWAYNTDTEEAVRTLRQGLELPTDYLAMHIRRGDKVREHSYVDIERYAEHVSALNAGMRTIFIATDDDRIIAKVAEVLVGYDLVSLGDQQSLGYDHAQFKSLPAVERRRRTLRLFAEMEVLRDAKWFLGSRTTNVAWFVKSHRGAERVIWVDTLESATAT